MSNIAIQIENLKFSFPYAQTNIIDVENYVFRQGDSFFIHGPSGSGKSTFLNLLTGILSPTQGKIQILDVDFSNLKAHKKDTFRGDHMGLIFQDFNLIPYLSVFENIQLPLKISKIKAKKVSNLTGEISQLCESLNIQELLDKKVENLSKGQQQRVACARALLGHPKIVIADEPTSSLDDENTSTFIKLLMDLQSSRNFLLLVVSHDQRLKPFFQNVLNIYDLKGKH